jgi:8-amino-3,8-dideoxy-alpha-D-manno-octulosonate transaminase
VEAQDEQAVDHPAAVGSAPAARTGGGQGEEDRPAIHGGVPAKRPSPPMYPGASLINEEEAEAALRVVRSRRLFRFYGLGDGPSQVAAFERAFAAEVGVPYALGVNSGTSALCTALAAAGIGPGDEVIVPAYTWVATAMAVAAVGGTPVVAEVDDSLTLDPRDLARKVSPRTRAVIPVHMRGTPADLQPILDICRPRGIAVIEDVAQADGGAYRGRRLGAWGELGCFSLQYTKLLTAGEGGVVTTSDRRLYERAVIFHDGASTGGREGFTEPAFLGMNFRMPELTGAVALAQLRKLPDLLSRLRRAASTIRSAIADLGLPLRRLPDPEGDCGICVVFFLPDPGRKGEVLQALRAENISCGSLWDPGSRDAHVYTGWEALLQRRAHYGSWRPLAPADALTPDACPRSLEYLHRAVHLDVHPLFTEEDVEGVIRGVRRVVRALL